MDTLQKVNIITLLKLNITIVLFFFVTPFLLGQNPHNTVYKSEFKDVGKNEFTKQLISLSKVQVDTKWDNYQGGRITTEDSLFNFNSNLLCFAFPTNSSTFRNTYLLYYFSQKTAKCPTLFSLLKYYEPIIRHNLEENELPANSDEENERIENKLDEKEEEEFYNN